MVRKNTAVHQCTIESDETIKNYIRRFKIPAIGFLNMATLSKDSLESQIFAMILSINAKIESHAFSTIISKLIANANSRTGSQDKWMLLSRDRFEKMMKTLEDDYENDNLKSECLVTAREALKPQSTEHSTDGPISYFYVIRNGLRLEESHYGSKLVDIAATRGHCPASDSFHG